MPKYDVEYPDGKKYTFESKKPLTKAEMEKAVQEYAQVVTEKKVGDVTERTITAKVGSPTPGAKSPSKLVERFLDEEEPRSKQFIRNAYKDIEATPSKDILDYVNEVFAGRRADRGKMKMGPLKLGSDALDLVRNIALSPVTIPKAVGEAAGLGYKESRQKGEFPGVGMAKNLGLLGLQALPFGGEAVEAYQKSDSLAAFPAQMKESVAKSFSESPVGMGLDVWPGAGVLKKTGQLGSGVVRKVASRRLRPEISMGPMFGPGSSTRRVPPPAQSLPPIPMKARPRGPRPAFHHDPEGMTPPERIRGEREHPDRLRFQDSEPMIREINAVLGRPEETGLSRTPRSMSAWKREIMSNPVTAAEVKRFMDPTNKRPVTSAEELMAMNYAIEKVKDGWYSLLDKADDIEATDPGKARDLRVEAERIAEQLYEMEVTLRKPFVSEASHTLLVQRNFRLHDLWEYDSVLSQVSDYVNYGNKGATIPLTQAGKREFQRITTQIRRRRNALMKKQDEEVLQSEGLAKEWFEANKTLLADEAAATKALKDLKAKRAELLAKLRQRLDKDGDTPSGMVIPVETLLTVAETALMAPAGLLLGVGGGGAGLAKPRAKNPKASAAKAIKEIDKKIEQVSKKKSTLGEQIGERMKSATAELDELGDKPLPPPTPEKKRLSSKGMTREEIRTRAEANKQVASEAATSKRASRKAELERVADNKIESILNNLGGDVVVKPGVAPIISADHVRRLREVTNLKRQVETIKKNLGTYLDKDLMDDLFEKVADEYRKTGNDAAKKILLDATEDARKQVAKERAAERVAKKRESTADARLEKLGEKTSTPKTSSPTTDHGRRVSKLNSIAIAMKKAYDGEAPADEIANAIELAKETYKNDPTPAGYEAAKAQLQQIRVDHRGRKASTKTREKAAEKLNTLGEERPKKVRNYLADEGARQFAQDVKGLDDLAQSYRKKYGVILGEETLSRLFNAAADKIRLDEENYHLPLVKAELQLAVENEVAKHRPFREKFWSGAEELLVNLPRSIMASADISYLGKQVGLAAAAHPVIGAKATVPGATLLAKGARVLKREGGKIKFNSLDEAREYVHAIEAEIVNNATIKYENRDFYTDVAGLDLNVPPPDLKKGWFSLLQGNKLSPLGQEELASSLSRKIPGVGRLVTTSDLAFSVGRNWAATKIFDKIYNHATMTPEDAAYIGKFVNMITGRTNWKEGWTGDLVRGSSGFLFSPRFAASRFEFAGEAIGSLMGLNPFRAPMGATGASAKALRVEMGKIALGYGAFYSAMAAAQMAGLPFEVGTDPRSVTFGTVKLPSGAYFDPLASMKQLLVTAYRATSGEQINLAGKERDVTNFDMWSRYVRSKLNPFWSNLTNMTPTFEPEKWRDYNGKLLAPDAQKHAAELANALGVIPTEKMMSIVAHYDATLSAAKKSLSPLGLSSLIEDVEFYSRKEGLTPEEYGFVVGHVISNALGYTVVNYDANRAENPNRKRGPSNPFSLPDPLSAAKRKMALPSF